MDAAQVLREARQSAALSQRVLASRSGVSLRSIAGIETGARQPTIGLLGRLLAACGQRLAVQDGADTAGRSCAHLADHLRRSLTERWAAAAGRTGRSAELHATLRTLPGDLVLEPAAAVPVWVPGAPLVLPLLVHFCAVHPSRRWAAPDPRLVVVRTGHQPLERGLVRVRAAGLLDVHVLPPAVLARQHCCRTWRPALEAAARLLHDDAGRDGAARRPAAHRQPDEDEEARRLSHSLRWTGLPRPSAQDSRHLRLDAPVGLPRWLDERGLPPLLGQRTRW